MHPPPPAQTLIIVTVTELVAAALPLGLTGRPCPSPALASAVAGSLASLWEIYTGFTDASRRSAGSLDPPSALPAPL